MPKSVRDKQSELDTVLGNLTFSQQVMDNANSKVRALKASVGADSGRHQPSDERFSYSVGPDGELVITGDSTKQVPGNKPAGGSVNVMNWTATPKNSAQANASSSANPHQAPAAGQPTFELDTLNSMERQLADIEAVAAEGKTDLVVSMTTQLENDWLLAQSKLRKSYYDSELEASQYGAALMARDHYHRLDEEYLAANGLPPMSDTSPNFDKASQMVARLEKQADEKATEQMTNNNRILSFQAKLNTIKQTKGITNEENLGAAKLDAAKTKNEDATLVTWEGLSDTEKVNKRRALSFQKALPNNRTDAENYLQAGDTMRRWVDTIHEPRAENLRLKTLATTQNEFYDLARTHFVEKEIEEGADPAQAEARLVQLDKAATKLKELEAQAKDLGKHADIDLSTLPGSVQALVESHSLVKKALNDDTKKQVEAERAALRIAALEELYQQEQTTAIILGQGATAGLAQPEPKTPALLEYMEKRQMAGQSKSPVQASTEYLLSATMQLRHMSGENKRQQQQRVYAERLKEVNQWLADIAFQNSSNSAVKVDAVSLQQQVLQSVYNQLPGALMGQSTHEQALALAAAGMGLEVGDDDNAAQ